MTGGKDQEVREMPHRCCLEQIHIAETCEGLRSGTSTSIWVLAAVGTLRAMVYLSWAVEGSSLRHD